MENFEFYRPTAYYFGIGRENETGNLVKALDKNKILLVYGGNSCVKSGLLNRVQSSLKKAGVNFVTKGGVVPNPRADLVYELIDYGRKEKVDFIIAIGGGSAIDTAKAVAIGIVNDGDFFDFFLKKRKPKDSLGIGVILTIPAVGSEGSCNAVIQKKINNEVYKCSFSCSFFVPTFAIMNPEVTKTLSAYQTACGTVDMMTHVMECYFTNSPEIMLTDRLCEAILTTIIETIPRVLRYPDNYEARANIMWEGTLAHNEICGVGNEQDWAPHTLEHQLSALYDVAHGAGLAVMYPAWMEYTMPHNPMRFAQFANRVFGLSMDFADPKRTAKAGIVALRNFFKSIGMPLNFADIGAKEEDIPRMLNLLSVDATHTIGNFVPLNRDACETIYKTAAQFSY